MSLSLIRDPTRNYYEKHEIVKKEDDGIDKIIDLGVDIVYTIKKKMENEWDYWINSGLFGGKHEKTD